MTVVLPIRYARVHDESMEQLFSCAADFMEFIFRTGFLIFCRLFRTVFGHAENDNFHAV